MSIFEFQITAPAFLAAQRNALRALGLCPPPLPAVSGVQIVIDRIDIGNNALRHNVETEFSVFYEDWDGRVPTKNRCVGYRSQIAQDLTVHLTTLADILGHPNQPPATILPFPVTLVFGLDFYSLEDECYLKIGLDKFELGPPPLLPAAFAPLATLPDDVQKQITDFLAQKLAPALGRAVPIGLASLKTGFKFVNAGLSIDTDMQRVALRVDTAGENENADVPWSNFFKGFFSDRLGGSDWGLFLEGSLLTSTIQTLVSEQLPKDDNLEAYPGCTYSHSDGKAILTIDVLLIYHLYRNYDLDIDISAEADPKVAIQLSVNSPDAVTVELDFAHLLDSDDPLVDLALEVVHLMGIPVESILFQLVGAAAIDKLKDSPLEDCKQTSSGHLKCETYVRVPHVTGGTQATLNKLLPFDDGFSLAGTMRTTELTAAVIQTTVRDFKVQTPAISCGAASMALVALFQQDPSNFAILHARALIENQGTAALNLCDVPTVLTGANGPFPQSDLRTDGQQAPVWMYVDIAAPSLDYYNDPYPLDVLVKTSGGTRLLRFNPPPVVTPQDYDRLTALLLVKVGNCEELVDPWFLHHQGYNPQWSPRPPEDGSTVLHLWEMEVSGLAAGEAAAVIGSNNQEIMRAAGSGGAVRLSAVLEPAGASELTLSRVRGREMRVQQESPTEARESGQSESGGGTGTRGIQVRQTLLIHLTSIPLPGRCRKLMATSLVNQRGVIAALERGVAAYDLREPRRPALARLWQAGGVRGVVEWQKGLVAFGHDGIEWLHPVDRKSVTREQCSRSVIDAAVDANAIYALTHDSLEVYSPRLCHYSSIPFEGGKCVRRVGNKLLVGGMEGLSVIDTSHGRLQPGETFLHARSITAIEPSLAGPPGSFLVMGADGIGRLLSFQQERPREIALFSEKPWFLKTVRIGNLLIRTGADRRTLDIYRYGESSLV